MKEIIRNIKEWANREAMNDPRTDAVVRAKIAIKIVKERLEDL